VTAQLVATLSNISGSAQVNGCDALPSFLLYTRESNSASHLSPHLILRTTIADAKSEQLESNVRLHNLRITRPCLYVLQVANSGPHYSVYPSQQADKQSEEQSTMHRQRRALPLNADDDNYGEALWRSGKTHATVCQLPESFDPLAFGDVTTKFNRLHQIALDTRTYLVRKKGGEIEVYGSPEDAAEAKSRILAWVEEYDLPKSSKRGSGSWTKVNRITPDQRDQIDKRIMREEKRNQWRKPPNIKNGKYMHRVSSVVCSASRLCGQHHLEYPIRV
jgi:hypothetical protein